MTAVRSTEAAREDPLDVWVPLARRDLRMADRIFDRIAAQCRLPADHPRLGRARPEFGQGARMLVIRRRLALYRLIEGGVQIVRGIDGVRDQTSLDRSSESGET